MYKQPRITYPIEGFAQTFLLRPLAASTEKSVEGAGIIASHLGRKSLFCIEYAQDKGGFS
jgi:hypothetical protein